MGKIFDALKKSGERTTRTESTTILEPVVEDGKETMAGAGEATFEDDAKVRIPPADEPAKKGDTIDDGAPIDIATLVEKPHAPQRRYPQDELDQNLVVYHSPHSFEAEQFRMLRTNILFPPKDKRSPRTILVTSALPEEGKSFVASNLALSIAQNIDKHVLLIDCDMRHPTIHKNFGYKNVPGLSNYLSGEQALADLLINTANDRLSILPGGPTPSNPSELLSSNRMLALLREVRARYDDRYVIIDSPPPHLTAESKALAQFVDGIILVVKLGSTNRDLVSQLVEKVQKERIIGVVANWIDQQATASYGSDDYAQYTNYYSPAKHR